VHDNVDEAGGNWDTNPILWINAVAYDFTQEIYKIRKYRHSECSDK